MGLICITKYTQKEITHKLNIDDSVFKFAANSYYAPNGYYNTREIPDKNYKKLFIAGSAFDMGKVKHISHLEKTLEEVDETAKLAAQKDNLVLITGACPKDSVPHRFVDTYRKNGGNNYCIGIVGGNKSINEHPYANEIKESFDILLSYDWETKPFGKDFFISLLYRDVINAQLADGLITFMGGAGTMGEASICLHQKKPVAFVSSTYGFSSVGKKTMDAIKEEGQNIGEYFDDSKGTVCLEWLLQKMDKKQ